MSTRVRLQPFIDDVKAAGLRGESMQAKLASILAHEDLTPHMIRRIAEEANRQVHIELTKQAHAKKADARIKFELCDPDALIADLRKPAKTASAQAYDGIESKIAAIEEAGGDPFAAPDTGAVSDSLRWLESQPKHAGMQIELLEAEYRDYMRELDTLEQHTNAIYKQAAAEELMSMSSADTSYKQVVQNALEMCMAGITLPSMYRAILATTAHAGGDDDGARKLMRAIVTGLKERGVPNSRMGFRRVGDRASTDAMSTEDIVSLCERAVAFDRGFSNPDLVMPLTKTAKVYLESQPSYKATDGRLTDEAEKYMNERESQQGDFLDDDPAFTDNEQGGKGPRVVNGESDFIIGVKDLVGARDRIGKLRSSQTYLAMKLDEIADTKGKLCEALEEQKRAFLPALGAVAGAVGRAVVPAAVSGLLSKGTEAVPATPKPAESIHTAGLIPTAGSIRRTVSRLGVQAAQRPLDTAIAATQVGTGLAPFVVRSADARAAEKQNKQTQAAATAAAPMT